MSEIMFTVPVPPPLTSTATVPSAFAALQTESSCENVSGTFSPNLANSASFVNMPAGASAGTNAYSPGPYLPSEFTSGSDHFSHGSCTSGARSPAFASTHTDTGVPQPGFVPSRSGALPAASSVDSSWYQAALLAA
jgi:hypothetical protein